MTFLRGRKELEITAETLQSLDNPNNFQCQSGRNSAVECQLPKLDVVGSTPIARSITLPSFAMLNGDSKEGWVG